MRKVSLVVCKKDLHSGGECYWYKGEVYEKHYIKVIYSYLYKKPNIDSYHHIDFDYEYFYTPEESKIIIRENKLNKIMENISS